MPPCPPAPRHVGLRRGRLHERGAGLTVIALGKQILGASRLNVIAADDLDDAAQKIVKAVKDAR